MKELPARAVLCPHCGYDNSRYHNDDFLLHEGSILNGKYMLGKKLGKGGFGITYLGMELLLHKKVAIKEFYPNDICSRSPGSKKVCVANDKYGTEDFLKGQDAFLKEAQTLALFDSPYIARVREYFQENDTSYIVMDYVGGTGFDQEMKRCGGRLPWKRVVSLMMGLMPELDKVHTKNLVHRDIKPPNLKIVRDEITGKEHLVLLDFGAARSFISSEVTGTYSAILTHGYAPFEQYQKRSHQGPYTDVYALCVTMYHAITGSLPPAALDRLGDGAAKIIPIHDFHLDVPDAVEEVIMHGLAFKSAERQQSMRELYDEFTAALKSKPSETVEPGPKNDQLYLSARRRMQENSKSGYEAAYSMLKQISGYKDADELADRCLKKLLIDYPVPKVIPEKPEEKIEIQYLQAKNAMKDGTREGYQEALNIFRQIPYWKDVSVLIGTCERQIKLLSESEDSKGLDTDCLKLYMFLKLGFLAIYLVALGNSYEAHYMLLAIIMLVFGIINIITLSKFSIEMRNGEIKVLLTTGFCEILSGLIYILGFLYPDLKFYLPYHFVFLFGMAALMVDGIIEMILVKRYKIESYTWIPIVIMLSGFLGFIYFVRLV